MTWTLKVRTSPGSLTTAEYLCPEHGRFDQLVERDANGDPPATIECVFVHDDAYDSGDEDCGCGLLAERVISAPLTRSKITSVTTGKQDGPPHPGYMDTREIGEGMPMNEWRKKRAKYHEEKRRKRIKEWMR